MLRRVVKTGKFIIDVKKKIVNFRRVDRPTAEWLKERLQAMGPTYIKIGQFISSRRDIFDVTLCDALRGLQDDIPPAPSDETIALIRKRLGKHIRKLESIEIEPIACASIGQVHAAKTKSGIKIAIKVRRPGVQEELDMDVKILMGMLTILDVLNTENVAETRELLGDFRKWFREETEYMRELSNWKLLKANVGRHNVIIPEFYEDLCHDDFIVMSYVNSSKMRDIKHGMSEIDREKLAVQLMETFIEQLVVDGVVHGDPHEGNVGLSGDGRIVLYDMGNVIEVDEATRTRLKHMLFEIVSGNLDDAVTLMKRISLFEVRDDAKVRSLLEKYAEYIRTVDVNVMSNIDMRGTLPIKFNPTVFRIVRVFGLLEGICKDLDPAFSYEAVFMKFQFSSQDYVSYKALSDVRKLARMVIETIDAL